MVFILVMATVLWSTDALSADACRQRLSLFSQCMSLSQQCVSLSQQTDRGQMTAAVCLGSGTERDCARQSSKGKRGHLLDFWKAMEAVSPSSVLFIRHPIQVALPRSHTHTHTRLHTLAHLHSINTKHSRAVLPHLASLFLPFLCLSLGFPTLTPLWPAAQGALSKRVWRLFGLMVASVVLIFSLSILVGYVSTTWHSQTIIRFTAVGNSTFPDGPALTPGIHALVPRANGCPLLTRPYQIDTDGPSLTQHYEEPLRMDWFSFTTSFASDSQAADPLR